MFPHPLPIKVIDSHYTDCVGKWIYRQEKERHIASVQRRADDEQSKRVWRLSEQLL